MGLDMYLYRTKKVNGLTVEDYDQIANYISDVVENDSQIASLDLRQVVDKDGVCDLISCIERKGECFQWYSIFEEVGYWRKANQIHRWFVDEVQNGVDECQLSLVPPEKLVELLHLVTNVQTSPSRAKNVLPVQSGFFFGGTEYDDWYFNGIKNTKKIIENLLATTNFDDQVVFYRSSW